MRYYLIPIRMATIKKTRDNICWQGYGEKGIPVYYWWKCKLEQPLQKTAWISSRNLKNGNTMWSSNPTSGYISKGNVNRIIKYPMFIETLFTIMEIWKQSKCPSMDEWVKKMIFKIQCNIIQQWEINKFCRLQQCGYSMRALC